MWEWLDEISGGDDVGWSSSETGAFDQFGSIGTSAAAGVGGAGYIPADLASYAAATGDVRTLANYLPGVNPLILQRAIGLGQDAVSRLIDMARPRSTWESIKSDPVGAAFSATPFLLALQQANSQRDDHNGVLNQIDGTAYTKTVLDPYDRQTGLGRTALGNDLGQRGVLGSSFGSQTLSNYDYSRNLGRSDLAKTAINASANLQGNLINQRNLSGNMLIGAGLNASGRLFNGMRDPFNLKNLGNLGAGAY